MKKLLKILFSFLVLSFFLVPQVKAADINIDCSASPTACSKSGSDPLFSNSLDGFWYPGKSITKTLSLKNSGSEMREMAIRGTRTSTVNNLENVMHISIVGGTTVIWSGSVADFYSQAKIGMGIFAPGANLNYDFTVFMSSDADDNYQNKETVFDLTLGFWGETAFTPTPTSAPGVVLGTGISAPVCNDTVPGGAPTLISAIGGVNSVTLTWSKASDPVTYYLVAYGVSPNDQTYGNPNIGGKDTTSYTVGGLSAGGTTYCFVVRAGNGCQTGPFSTPLCTTPGGVTVAGIAPGFTPGVLGVATPSAELSTPVPTSGEVAGISSCQNNYYPWWIPLVVQAVIALVLIYIARKKKWSVKAFAGINVIIAIVSQIVHEILGCNCATGYWCPKYIFINLIILGLAVLIHYRAISLKK